MLIHCKKYLSSFAVVLLITLVEANAQTEHDAIMMNKSQWCNGATYMHAKWTDYWEGTTKRSNENIGTLSTQSVLFMTNYGITNKLNIMAGLPYIWTKASGGTLHGLKGFQDVSVYLKWKPVTAKLGKGKLSLLAVGGISTPASDYVVDLLPLAIGMGTTNLTTSGVVDYQKGIFFTTIGGAYIRRSNVKLDRTSYYTTELHSTNEVQMPDMATFNFSIGIRKKYLIAEALINNMTTLGGFDIRKSDMPFSSNKMNSTVAGGHVKFTLPFYSHIELTADANYVIKGRNVGQATTFGLGGLYIFNFKHK